MINLTKHQLPRKRMFKLLIKLFPLFLLLFLVSNCTEETIEIQNKNFKTVSIQETVNYFKKNKSYKSQSKIQEYVTPYLEYISQDEITSSNQLITIVPSKTKFKNHLSRILLLRINNEIKSVVFNMYKNKNSSLESFSGEIIITNMQGDFLNGYRLENGSIISHFFRKANTQNKSVFNKSSGGECDWHDSDDPNCILNMQNLEEVVITVPSNTSYLTLANLYGGGEVTSTSGCEVDCNSWNFGNGASASDPNYDPNTNKCKQGYIENEVGICVVQEKPCIGDPVANPEIAPQKGASGVKGGMYGCNRFYSTSICGGIKGSKEHNGIDIRTSYGDPIYATHDGTAKLVTQYKKGKVVGAGHYVEVTSKINEINVKFLFFHMQKDNRTSGTVKAGDLLGYQGDSGNLKEAIAEGYAESHVHIKVKADGSTVNPNDYLGTKFNQETGEPIKNENCN